MKRFEQIDDKAALVVRAHDILMSCPPQEREALRDVLRQCIAGLPPESADAELVALFADVEVCDQVLWEHDGIVRCAEDDGPYPF